MTAAGLWVPRAQRLRRSQPPRPRRACLGELVQIDGSEHAWFEDRGPVCTLLVYVDDATSRLMELAFAAVESTFDYFRATRRYLGAPRKADGLLQRSTQRLSCPRPRARSERPWALTIRARPAGAQHRPPLRAQSRSQGAGRTGQRHLAGPARQRAAVARPPRSRRRRPVPSRVHGRLQPALRQTARRGLRRASPAAPRRRPHPALHPCRRRVASVASSPCTTNAISTCSTTRSPPGDGAARRWSSAKPRTARSPCASTAACWQPASTRRITPSSIPASSSSTSISTGSSPSSLRNSSSAMPLAPPARSLPAVRRTVSTPAQPCGPPPCHPGKADISTWGRSGHFYFVLTPTVGPAPLSAAFLLFPRVTLDTDPPATSSPRRGGAHSRRGGHQLPVAARRDPGPPSRRPGPRAEAEVERQEHAASRRSRRGRQRRRRSSRRSPRRRSGPRAVRRRPGE